MIVATNGWKTKEKNKDKFPVYSFSPPLPPQDSAVQRTITEGSLPPKSQSFSSTQTVRYTTLPLTASKKGGDSNRRKMRDTHSVYHCLDSSYLSEGRKNRTLMRLWLKPQLLQWESWACTYLMHKSSWIYLLVILDDYGYKTTCTKCFSITHIIRAVWQAVTCAYDIIRGTKRLNP